MNASFEEKSVWIHLVCVLGTFILYCLVAWSMLSSGVDTLMPFVGVFLSSVVLLVILLVAGHLLAAVTGRIEKPDERDRLIVWRSESNSAWMLVVGIFAAITAMLFSLSNVWVAHILILSLYLSQTMQYLFQIRYYRRGV
ncbi:MAG: hypothetical protein EA380_08695 [Phycisphaeraceae bacterium]|nr:MAG: hypothetical protein EA380_08695 [Phycisphaeraceae bacterium]